MLIQQCYFHKYCFATQVREQLNRKREGLFTLLVEKKNYAKKETFSLD